MRGSRLVVSVLERMDVDRAFGLVGSTILDILNEVRQSDQIEYITTRHEQVAGGMAAGYALATRRPAVSMSHVGPGAANQVIETTAAFRDNIPVITLTGNEESHLLGKDTNHEWDVMGVFERITDHNVQIDEDDPYNHFRAAILRAVEGMPGAVHIDIPEDVAAADLDAPTDRQLDRLAALDTRASPTRCAPPPAAIEDAVELLAAADRPLLVAGNELRWFDATDALREFAELVDIPVATSQNARGALPETHRLSLGHIANSGIEPATEYAANADLVLAVGSRLSDKTTSEWTLFDPDARIIQASIRGDELNRYYSADVSMVCDPTSCLEALVEAASPALSFGSVGEDAAAEVAATRERALEPRPLGEGDAVDPRRVVQAVRDVAGDYAYTTGGGVHNKYPCLVPVGDLNGRFVTANFTGMSQGLPLGLGAKLGLDAIGDDRELVVFEGDGGFAMVVQDLETAAREDIPIKVFVLNNDAFMSHATRQDDRYGARIGTEYGNPPYDEIAEAYGCFGDRIDRDDEVREVVERLFEHDGPGVVDVTLDPAIGTQGFE